MVKNPILNAAITLVAVAVAGGALTVAAAVPASAAAVDSEVLASALAFEGHPGAPSATTRTVTLPLHLGVGPTGRPVGYIVTESSSAPDAAGQGVNFAPKLANALGTRAVQRVTLDRRGPVHFTGTVDFAPRRQVVPGTAPNYFPPTSYTPGAVGDAAYSPLTSTGDGVVVNRPQVINDSGVNDSVVSLDLARHTVTLSLFGGFYEDHPILYIRTEASNPLLAAIASSTYAPNLNTAPGLASDDPTTSSREAIVPIANGPTGLDNPQRQGLNSALAGEGAPLNIIQEEPGGPSSQFYSPVWDVTPAQWSPDAITTGTRTQLRSIQAIQQHAETGALTGFATGPTNPAINIHAADFVSLCPVIAVLPVP